MTTKLFTFTMAHMAHIAHARRLVPMALLLAACVRAGDATAPGGTTPGGTTPPPSAPPSVERQVNATVTDPAITAAPAAGEAPHVVINPSPSATAQGKPLLFLPGTQGDALAARVVGFGGGQG